MNVLQVLDKHMEDPQTLQFKTGSAVFGKSLGNGFAITAVLGKK